jgi:FixJ family two-component response regulator
MTISFAADSAVCLFLAPRDLRPRTAELPKLPVISIVDDDAPLREAIVCLMRSLGYDARSFGSAEEFLGSPHVDTTSCLIADVQMPGMSGFELQQSLLAKGCKIPIIFISAFPGERLKAKAVAPDPVCFLNKPFDTKTLVECLEKALRETGSTGS